MKIAVTSIVAVLLTVLCLAADGKVGLLHFKASGFSIAPLEDDGKDAARQPLTMSLPPSDGFAPNVNVQLQPYPGSLDDFVTLSTGQFKAAKLKVITDKRDAQSHIWEYSGELQGKSLHFFARAEVDDGVAYLATATALEKHWPKYKIRLIKCIDSFAHN